MSQEIYIPNKEQKEIPRVLGIGVDLDDTVFDIAGPSLDFLNQRFHTNFTKREIKEFWYIQTFLKQLGHREEEIQSFYNEVYRSADKHRVYRNSKPLSGAIEVLNGLHRSGHKIYILTSRPPALETIVEEQFRAIGITWIGGDWVDGGNILIRDHYYWESMTGEEFKLRAITGGFPDGKYKDFPGLDLHLDDMGELIHHPLATEIKDRIFILSQIYNINIVPKENLVNNWWVFYKLVRCRVRGEEFNLVNVAQY